MSYFVAGLGMLSFSREQEAESDLVGLSYLDSSGYDPAQGAKAFEQMMSLPSSAGNNGSIYSSHPRTQRRISSLQKELGLASLPRQSSAPSDIYNSFREQAIKRSVKMHLQSHRYQLSLDLIDRAEFTYGPMDTILYYRGETYRLMADYPHEAADEEALINGKRSASEELSNKHLESTEKNRNKAKQSFQAALDLNSDMHMAHKGLGLNAKAQGDFSQAKMHLDSYMIHSKSSREMRHLKNLLKEMELQR